MQFPGEAMVLRSLMVEFIDLLGDFPPERNRRKIKALQSRLADLELRARSQGAAPETVAAIQGARVLLDLAEMPTLSAANVATG